MTLFQIVFIHRMPPLPRFDCGDGEKVLFSDLMDGEIGELKLDQNILKFII